MAAALQRRSSVWQAALSVLLGLAALGCAVVGVQAWLSSRAAAAPLALSPLPEGGLWVIAPDEIWEVDAAGRLRHRIALDDTGLPALPSQVVSTPSGRLLAAVPGQADLLVLDRRAVAQDRLPLQWPAALRPAPQEQHLRRLAIHPDGRIASTAGSGTAVAVFDERGALQRHTELPGTTELTALWWDGEELWVADSASATLLRLGARDLAVRGKVALAVKGRGLGCLAHAVPHPRHGIEMHAPLATVTRLNCRTGEGRVSHVWLDGLEQEQKLDGWARPEDLAWLGDGLLVAEGRSGRLKRFSVDREALADFGDEGLRRVLQERQQHREAIWLKAVTGAMLAVMLLLAAGLAASWRRRGGRTKPVPALDAKPPPTRPPSGFDTGGEHGTARHEPDMGAHATSTTAPPSVAVLAPPPTPTPAPPVVSPTRPPVQVMPENDLEAVMRQEARFLGTPMDQATASATGSRRPGRLAFWIGLPSAQQAVESPAAEAWVNAQAVKALLSTPAFLRDREPGEQPRETLILSTAQGPCWLLVTNRRILAYGNPQAPEPVLQAASRRDELNEVKVGRAAGRVSGRAWRQPGTALRLRFNDGRVLQGWTVSAVTARRLATLLNAGLARAPQR